MPPTIPSSRNTSSGLPSATIIPASIWFQGQRLAAPLEAQERQMFQRWTLTSVGYAHFPDGEMVFWSGISIDSSFLGK